LKSCYWNSPNEWTKRMGEMANSLRDRLNSFAIAPEPLQQTESQPVEVDTSFGLKCQHWLIVYKPFSLKGHTAKD